MQTAVIVCPGRGTYNQSELGYLKKHEGMLAPQSKAFLDMVDQAREARGQQSVRSLDGEQGFKSRLHGTGDNASALIYACALADFQSIDLEKYEIVAVTGNSMGWYLALACAGVLPGLAGFEVVNSMGVLMHEHGLGGQVIYPLVDEHWCHDSNLEALCSSTVSELNEIEGIEIYTSIELGGMRVLAANEKGMAALIDTLPRQQGRFPFKLQFHSGFHSPLLAHIPAMAKAQLNIDLFQQATIPLVDGRGKIWQPKAYDLHDIYDYTFEHQITSTYNFSSAIDVSIKEFAPDKLIVLGPGTTLGPPIAQSLIKLGMHDIDSKEMFSASQSEDPFLLSMGIDEQRRQVVLDS